MAGHEIVTRKSGIPTFLTVDEVADQLRCCSKTIRRRVHAGTLPAFKEGGRFLFDADVIRVEVMARMVRPKPKPTPASVAGDASDEGSPTPYT